MIFSLMKVIFDWKHYDETNYVSAPYALRAFHEYQKCGKSHYGLGETILSDKSNIQAT
jgi:hypothetical protein